MAFSDDIKAMLVADVGAGGVNTLLTGGIYTFADTGRNGIDRLTAPGAFNGTILKPCAVVKDRAQVPDGGVMDDAAQKVSFKQYVEIWLYNNGDAGYGTIEQVKARIFFLLHGKPVGTNKNIARWMGNNQLSGREPELENAVFERTEYEFRALMTAS